MLPRSAALAMVLLAAALPASAAVIVLDQMTLELPVNSCFPVTQARVVAWGDYCDAPSCPPGIPVPTGLSCYYSGELGLPTGLGESARNVAVEGGETNSVHARVVPAGQVIECHTTGGEYSSVFYGFARMNWSSRDLIALGVQSFRAVVGGEVSAAHPLYLAANCVSPPGGLSRGWIQVDAPGTYDIPLASLGPVDGPAADLHDLDQINFTLGDCIFDVNCEGKSFPARSYTLGTVSLVTDTATPVKRRTWASVKQIYR